MGKQDTLRKDAKIVTDNCYAARFRMLNRIVTRLYNEAFTASGVTAGQFNILTAMILMESSTSVRIGAVLHMEKSTLSRNLRLMEANGWIAAQGEGRSIALSVTDEGSKRYKATLPHWHATQKKVQDLMGKQSLGLLDDSIMAMKGSVL